MIGLSIFSTVHEHYMAFLRYLAVHASARNRGLGRHLLNDALQTVRADGWAHAGYPYLGLVFEVERPGEAETDAERTIRERRIGWYVRNGARLYPNVDLTTPPVSPDQPPVSYHLMFRAAVPKRMVGRTLRRMMVESVLVHGYGAAPDSRYVQRAMAG
ncbi:MAG: GNAT family N-acetyltransferase [Chloroflexi bacterium]|nr:GNAT family N-acetyltransferase [Chloroflexota bacterium]